MKLIGWLLKTLVIPAMHIVLTLAGYFTAVKLWTWFVVSQGADWYSSEDAAVDVVVMLVLWLVFDRLFGPHNVALRRVAKRIAAAEKENNDG